MPEPPNLDYEPGPVGASYSRLGPPCEERLAPRTVPAVRPENFRHEVAEELGAPTRRRHRRRR